MTRRLALHASAALAALALTVPAEAAFESAYTDIDLNDCLLLEADDFGASWACPGYRGYPMLVSEGDLRFSIRYGFNIDDEPGGETLGPFNELGPRIEWRLSDASGRWLPIATIVRYHTANPETGENEGQILVVTQLVEGATCHIAYVDAIANDNANALAREAADEMAGNTDCGGEPEIIGDFEAW